jgi:hypothetical protein
MAFIFHSLCYSLSCAQYSDIWREQNMYIDDIYDIVAAKEFAWD